jgi:uncharacterized protein (DUF1501 family)
LPSLDEAAGVTIERLEGRQTLLEQLDQAMRAREASHDTATMTEHQRKALDLLTSSRARAALDLSREPESTRARYGPTLYGTSLLAARRLIEAGVTLVTVTTESRGAGHWDSHSNNFGMLKTFHLPNLDQIAAALVDDLDQRGLLDSTLVAIMGEMGRTPRINKSAGRDHWPQCGFALFFGGGVRQGFVLGSSDRLGAYPVDHPVSPGDLVATIYHLLGVDPALALPDLTGRPVAIAHGGRPVRELLA